jgi:ribosomal protein S18 acetylase RimI-like enzyme
VAERVSDISIRRGVLADAPALAHFAARTFAEAFGDVTAPADLSAHLANTYTPALQAAELADPDVITLLALLGDGIVAYAQVRRNAAVPSCIERSDVVEVQRFYADSSVRGAGVAQQLMERALDAAIELGGRHAWLGVWQENERAVAFYRKAGFVPVGTTVYVVGSDHQTDHVMLATDIATRKTQ